MLDGCTTGAQRVEKLPYECLYHIQPNAAQRSCAPRCKIFLQPYIEETIKKHDSFSECIVLNLVFVKPHIPACAYGRGDDCNRRPDNNIFHGRFFQRFRHWLETLCISVCQGFLVCVCVCCCSRLALRPSPAFNSFTLQRTRDCNPWAAHVSNPQITSAGSALLQPKC